MSRSERRFVKVTWHDAADNGQTWVQAEEIQPFTEELCVVVSWGWLVGATKKYVTLAADHIVDGPYGRVTKIPVPMIMKIEDFKDE